MMFNRISQLFLFSLFMLVLVQSMAAQPSIKWETDFDAALKKASDAKKIIFVAINMDGERANDEAVRVHYRDKTIVSLSKNTINLFASVANHGRRCKRVSGMTCKQHQKIEIKVREKFLKIPANQGVIAPQHLFISPDGKILLSVVYQIKVGELEWMFAEALKQNDPKFKWKASGSARAPFRVKFGYERSAEAVVKPPTVAEVKRIIEDVRKGKIGFRQIADKFMIIIRSPDKEATKFVKTFIHSRWVRGDRRLAMIRAIGQTSPPNWYELIAPFLAHEDRDTRMAAVIATERLGAPKAVGELFKRWQKESDEAIKGRVLRALSTVKPKDRKTCKLLLKILKKDKNTLLRMHATLAIGLLEDRKTVTTGLALALADGSPKVRSTAAFVIARRRDKELRTHLLEVLKRETDPETKKWCEEAKKALAGGKLDAFKKFLVEQVGDVEEKEKTGLGGGGGGGGGRRRR